MCRGYVRKNTDDWKRTRKIAYLIYLANRDPKKNTMSESEFMPLGDEDEGNEISKEELQQRKKAFETMVNRSNLKTADKSFKPVEIK